MQKTERLLLLQKERLAYGEAVALKDVGSDWSALEREHILAQPFFWPHLRSHSAMLCFAIRQRDIKETSGQILRLLLAPIGNVFGRLPHGNTGRSNVSAFPPMSLPPDLADAMHGEIDNTRDA